MKLANHVLPYIKGEKFSSGLEVTYDYYDVIPNRIDLLKSLSTGKKVVHLGCLDHLPLIEGKVRDGRWLHQQLTQAAKKCIGVDINRETQEYVREKFHVENVVIADITRDPIPEITAERWDYAIIGELLEHVDNPVQYLHEIKTKYRDHIDRLIITVPNAFTVVNFKLAGRSIEFINSDHRYWFTPYTVAKVVAHAGLDTEEVLFANRLPLPTSELIKRRIYKWLGRTVKHNFTYASSIICIARL